MVPIENVRGCSRPPRSAGAASRPWACSCRSIASFSNLGPVGMLIREQPTLRHAISALSRHSQQLNEVLFITLEESGEVAVLREVLIVGHGGAVRQSTELMIAVVFPGPARLPRQILEPAGHLLRASRAARPFRARTRLRPAPAVQPGLQRHRGSRRGTSTRPTRWPTPRWRATRSRWWTRRARRVRPRGRRACASSSWRCSLEAAVAPSTRSRKHLGVTRRTVHRQLAAEGESYEKILDSVRRELATRYLRDLNRAAGRSLLAARLRRAYRILTLVQAPVRRDCIDAAQRRNDET